MPVPKISRGALRSARLPRAAQNGQFVRAGRRGYASGQDSGKQGARSLSSEMPWAVSAVVATVVGSYLVASGHKFTDPINHPMPGDNYHPKEHDDEEEEEEGEGEAEEGGDDEAAPAEEGEGEGEEEDSSSTSGSSGKLTGKRVPGQPEDNMSKRSGTPWDQATELEKGPKGQTRLYLPDAKGGVKRRSESAAGIVQGRQDPNDTEGGSIGDVKDGSKSAVAGSVSRFQKGVSNTDTKHSIDLMKGDQHSKKSEGVPETAKIVGTVDPKRDI